MTMASEFAFNNGTKPLISDKLTKAITARMSGAGGLYNLGTALALFGGIIVHYLTVSSHQSFPSALRDYLFGNVGSASLTFSMILFLIGGEVYHRAYENKSVPNQRLVTAGDLLFGIAAIICTMALASVGNTAFALCSGTLLAISKFGSVLFPEVGERSENRAKLPNTFRWMAIASKVPALACVGLTLFTGVTTGETGSQYNVATIMLVSYLLWLAGDCFLLRSSETTIEIGTHSPPPFCKQPAPLFMDTVALRANEQTNAEEFLNGAKARTSGPGGRYNCANMVNLIGGITVYCIATASFQSLDTAFWNYFFGSIGSASLTLATITFLIAGETYHRANTRFKSTNLQMIRLGDFIIGIAAIFLTFALASFGNHFFAILAGLLLIASKWGSAAFPSKADASKAYTKMCAAFRWMTITSRFPSLAAVGITLYAGVTNQEFSSQVAIATIIFISQLMLLSGDWMLLKITRRA